MHMPLLAHTLWLHLVVVTVIALIFNKIVEVDTIKKRCTNNTARYFTIASSCHQGAWDFSIFNKTGGFTVEIKTG
jgi:hypothetical protein